MRAAFYTLGCKVNQYETQILIQQFSAYGYDIVDSSDAADVYVINSCTVTASGDKKTRQIIHRMKRTSPGAVIALTGCFPQAFPEEAAKLEEVDILVGAGEKKKVLEYVNRFLKEGKRIVEITPHTKEERFEAMHADSFLERTRAFVKIQDGCEHYCSYCIIPYARGFNRSKSLEDLKLELYDLSAKGYKEVVLVGIDLSSYGKDIGCHLVDAVTMACTTEGIERVRLGSLEPLMLTDQNLSILAGLPNFCPQFHLSLQSGCDETLRRINRTYDAARYAQSVALLNQYFDRPAITTDLICGFPEETEEEFSQTLRFIASCGFAQMHIFPYSVRPGTPAAEMPQVPKAVKEERCHRAAETAAKMRRAYLEGCVGQVYPVLFEQPRDGKFFGHAPNYMEVLAEGTELHNEVRNVVITAVEGESLLGRIQED